MTTTIRARMKQNSFIRSLYNFYKQMNTRARLSLGAGDRFKIQAVNLPGGISLIRNLMSDTAYFFPYGSRNDFNSSQLGILSKGFHEHLLGKYTTEAFDIAEGDTVIDCGGFVGGFSVAAALSGADRILYVEPTPLSRRCGVLNFELHACAGNIDVIPCGLGEVCGHATLHLSRSMADNSLLEPDETSTGEDIEVEIITVEELSKRYTLDYRTTFLKVEAEGFEVEIIRGLSEFLPYKIAVDVTPERGGKSPRDEIKDILESKGYTSFKVTDLCLFAQRKFG